jgi:mannose-6-phosphate isomerase-like protein (cupin superfamily)
MKAWLMMNENKDRIPENVGPGLLAKASSWDEPGAPKPEFFSIRPQLLEAGNTEEPLSVADNLWVKVKVYAKGGENKLHAHPNQDHSFIVLDGVARFHGPRGEARELSRNQGIMLPAGSYYWFETISEAPLVLLRIGAVTGDGHPDARTMDDGETKIRRGRNEIYISPDVRYAEGKFYE